MHQCHSSQADDHVFMNHLSKKILISLAPAAQLFGHVKKIIVIFFFFKKIVLSSSFWIRFYFKILLAKMYYIRSNHMFKLKHES